MTDASTAFHNSCFTTFMATQSIMDGVPMRKLGQQNADRLVTGTEFSQLKGRRIDEMALRCNAGLTDSGGDGYNLSPDNYVTSTDYATAVYAAVCISQDTIQPALGNYHFPLMGHCAISNGDAYNYVQGSRVYATLSKCPGSGGAAQVNAKIGASGSAI
jgi:hypothetical protein